MVGKRVQYLHPVKMYIFISLVYFVLLFKSGFEPEKVTHTEDVKSKKSLVAANKKLDSITKDPCMPIFTKKMVSKAKEENEKAIKKLIKRIRKPIHQKNIKTEHVSIFGAIVMIVTGKQTPRSTVSDLTRKVTRLCP